MSDTMTIKCTCGNKCTTERTANIGEVNSRAYSILIEVLGAELARYIHHSTPIHDLQTNALKRETS